VYYLNLFESSSSRRIFDFKDGIEMLYKGGKRLHRGKPVVDIQETINPD